MGRNTKILLMFVALFFVLLSIGQVCAADFHFEIKVKHSFDDGESFDCRVKYDSSSKDWSFDDEDSSSDYVFDKNFKEDIEFECDGDLDEIQLTIEDPNGERVYRNTYKDTNDFSYVLNRADESDKWFEIEINHEFASDEDIICDLSIDSDVDVTYVFNKDTSTEDLNIQRNYDDDMELSCDSSLDEIDFTVYNEDGDDVFKKTYYNKELFDFEDDDIIGNNQVTLRFDHEFASGEVIRCSVKLDDDDNRVDQIDLSESSVKKYSYDFRELMELDCGSKVDEIRLVSENEDGDVVDDLTYEREDDIKYEFQEGDYEYTLVVKNEFGDDDEVECDLREDDKDKKEHTFSKNSGLSDLTIEGTFSEELSFACDEQMDSFSLYVFYIDDFNKEHDVIQKEYTKTSSFDFVISDFSSYVDDSTDNEDVNAGVADGSNSVNESEVEGSDDNSDADALDDSSITNVSGSDSSVGKSNDSGKQSNGSTVLDNNGSVNITVGSNESGVGELGSQGGLGMIAFALIIAILVIFAVILAVVKLSASAPKKGYKSVNQRDEKVDFDFLKKKR